MTTLHVELEGEEGAEGAEGVQGAEGAPGDAEEEPEGEIEGAEGVVGEGWGDSTGPVPAWVLSCAAMAYRYSLCLLFVGAIAGSGYLTHLVTIEEEQPLSPPLSPPSSPPQPSNLPLPPLSPPSPVPRADYLTSLAMGLIGGGMIVLIFCLMEKPKKVPHAESPKGALKSHESFEQVAVVIYPVSFSAFVIIGLTQVFERCAILELCI